MSNMTNSRPSLLDEKTAHDGNGLPASLSSSPPPLDPSERARVPIWNRAWTQLLLVSFCAFCLPGMYNAISGMGGSGQLDPTVGANSSVALLSVGAATGLLVGQPMYDLLGNKCMFFGGWTYALYTGALLAYSHHVGGGFVIASGAILGLGATLLWVTQGAIMLSYPLANQKGRSIATFWVIFNLGGAIGSFISLGLK